jgi:copper oxidase (laccase) domain-containing protein
MNPEFSIVSHRGIELLVYLPWWRAGLVHGMSTAQLPGSKTNVIDAARSISKALCLDHLVLPLQCHGAGVVDLRSVERCKAMIAEHGDLLRRESGDALVAPPAQPLAEVRLGYGVATADCVPILVRGADGYVLIHAGWRGLGNGVIRNGLSVIRQPAEALVFACAGGGRYEVGAEVLAAIGSQSVYVPSPERADRFLLDTAATAIRQLRDECPELQVFGADVCTLSDTRFHSFRRDGDAAGRAITFIVPPQK